MKILATLVLAMLAIAVFSPMALAEENPAVVDSIGSEDEAVVVGSADSEEVEIESAGIGPDSAFYGLDRAMERIRLALTFNKAKRAEIALKHAEERLAEVKAMIEAKKLEKVEIARDNYEKDIEQAQEAAEEIESDGDKEAAKDAAEKIARIRERLRRHAIKVAAVKASILARQRERMTEEQIARMEQIFGRIVDSAEAMESRVLQRQEAIRTRYRVLSGRTEEEIDEELEEAEDSEEAEGAGEEVQTQAGQSE